MTYANQITESEMIMECIKDPTGYNFWFYCNHSVFSTNILKQLQKDMDFIYFNYE
jgi:hypothetical protein